MERALLHILAHEIMNIAEKKIRPGKYLKDLYGFTFLTSGHPSPGR
jgi:hypothetical protein